MFLFVSHFGDSYFEFLSTTAEYVRTIIKLNSTIIYMSFDLTPLNELISHSV